MSVLFPRGPGQMTRQGGALAGEMSFRPDGRKPAMRTLRPEMFDPPLAAWFAAAADGDIVEIIVDVSGDGQPVAVRMAAPPVIPEPVPDPERVAAADRLGGGANPYTFIPSLPRNDMPAGLGSAAPASHALVDPGTQWSGWLVLRLETRTPLLLPDPEAVTRDPEDHPTYPVRRGADGGPLLHGASVKGALRSAYEAVTASRFGVFRGPRPGAGLPPAGLK